MRSHPLALLVAAALLVSCAGTGSAAYESWTLVELMTKGERRDVQTEIVDVRNCGVAERKTFTCSAGTSNDLQVSLEGAVDVVKVGSVAAGISMGLGLGRTSGEEIGLDTPPDGYVYRYTIRKEFQVLSGQLLAQSASGKRQPFTYAFNARCSLRIESPQEQLTCAEADAQAAPTDTPAPPVAKAPVDTPATTPPIARDMVHVPAGAFQMGSTDADPNAQDDEKPQHTVYLDAFWIDRTEVTNAQYAKCVAAGACAAPASVASSTHGDYYGNAAYADYPVVNVDWTRADAYCRWAGGRLPTEAEWEKAARGTDGRLYPWGNEAPDAQRANFNNNVGDTTPVGNYSSGASPYGALDMAGNVWEWVNDWYDGGYYSISPDRNPPGPATGTVRVLRGGGWGGSVYFLRVADRDNYYPTIWPDDFGVRCVAVPGR